MLACGLPMCFPSAAATAGTPYGVVDSASKWDVALGHHRARVDVTASAPAVRVHLPWRLPLSGMDGRAILVNGPDGAPVSNAVRLTVSRESADVAFEATSAGEYHLYYLPYAPERGWGGCNSRYAPFRETADNAWRERNGLAASEVSSGAWRRLPEARVLEFQARSDFDRFDPMEVIATRAEVDALLAAHPEPLLLFPEDRRHAIRMQRDLPRRWVENGPAASFSGEAMRDEYFAFQIGVHAPRQPATRISVTASPLRGPDGAEIPASAITCYNLQGVDTWGLPFAKEVHVPIGAVQPLWFGVDVARNQKPGRYEGRVAVAADGIAPREVQVRLDVSEKIAESRGDNELWRLSRIRWLNSGVGLENELIAPYTPLRVTDSRIACLGREVTLAPDGLPARIASGSRPVLAAPLRLVVEEAGGALAFRPDSCRFAEKTDARVRWIAGATADGATIACQGRMEFDGHLNYRVTLKAGRDLDLQDVRLELPIHPDSAQYIMGIGLAGGTRPPAHEWKWQGPYDSFWLGGVHAGLWCELRGGTYHGPMLNLYHPAPPSAWANGDRGGVRVREEGGVVTAAAFSGARKLKAGEEITFEFALLVTPVKPLDTAAHFRARYFHGNTDMTPYGYNPDPPGEALAAGVNVVNVHHATTPNPYINYPFIANDRVRALTSAMHARNVKVKLYYTLRELSNYVEELWILRSLGDEVMARGGGGGHAWLQEHLGAGYRPSWYSPFPDGSADHSFVNSGESRWYNYYIEGLGWMVRNLGIDGLYLDDVSYDRHILQRMRRVMARERPGCLLDLHSNTAFSIGPANQYLEFFPYLDRLWFGESFNYHAMTPDQWLVQVSGIPFGLMGEMLHAGGHPWRGPLYGMTTRLGWNTEGTTCDPREVWKVWDGVGLAESRMAGYWEPDCPVRTDDPLVPATVYARPGRALVALASWAPDRRRIRLQFDWKALGLDPSRARLHAPYAEGFQPAAEFSPGDAIPVKPDRGWMLILDENAPAPDGGDPLSGTPPTFMESFAGDPAARGWARKLSALPGVSMEARNGELAIACPAHAAVYIARPLPPRTRAIGCRLNSGTDQGESWGPGLALRWPDGRMLRFYVRSREGRFGRDIGDQQIFPGSAPRGVRLGLRVVLDDRWIRLQSSEDEEVWETVDRVPRESFPGDPAAVWVGKSGPAGEDHTTPGAPGYFVISDFRLWAAP